jgi:hypothetical protein
MQAVFLVKRIELKMYTRYIKINYYYGIIIKAQTRGICHPSKYLPFLQRRAKGGPAHPRHIKKSILKFAQRISSVHKHGVDMPVYRGP